MLCYSVLLCSRKIIYRYILLSIPPLSTSSGQCGIYFVMPTAPICKQPGKHAYSYTVLVVFNLTLQSVGIYVLLGNYFHKNKQYVKWVAQFYHTTLLSSLKFKTHVTDRFILIYTSSAIQIFIRRLIKTKITTIQQAIVDV